MVGRHLRSGRQDLPPPTPPKTHIEFDFVIAERPRYIPGSGPPLAPISVMPAHDRDGYIIEEAIVLKELRYLVGYEQQPHLRVSVKLSNILNWVSPRALEQYHSNKSDEREREREAVELPLIEAKEERRRKRLEKLSREGRVAETESRKRKRTPLDEFTFKGRSSATPSSGSKKPGRPPGPGRRNQPVEEEVSYTSPKQSQHSQQQPSLAAPGGALANRTVFDSDSDDEGSTATEIALEYHAKSGRARPSNLRSSRSISNSPPVTSRRNTRSRSTSKPVDTSREGSSSVSDPQSAQRRRSQNLPQSILPGKSAVAATSSREALKVYEDLERKNRKPQTIADKYSYTRKASQSQTFKGAQVGLAGPAGPSRGLAQVVSDDETDEPEEEEEDETEYEVKSILDDEIRLTKEGEKETWYLIKWVGEWDDTWEPAENVGDGAIKEYEDEKRKKKGRRTEDGNESDPDSLFVSDRKGKGKEVKWGQVIDDDDDGEDDEMQWQALGASA